MSQWAPDTTSVIKSQDTPALEGSPDHPDGGSYLDTKSTMQAGRTSSTLAAGFIGIAPFFLSALFFLSAFFAVFSPLPLVLSHFKKGRYWTWAAAAVNAILVYFAAGGVSLCFYLVFVTSLSLSLPEWLLRRKRLEEVAVFSLVTLLFCGLVTALVYWQWTHLNPVSEIRMQITAAVDFLAQSVPQTAHSPALAELEDWKRDVLVEFPSVVAVFALVLTWVNLVIVLKANPSGIRKKLGLDDAFLKKWKAPEPLVWPTIACGFVFLAGNGQFANWALNGFKFLMAIYALQGLSILSFLFDVWSIRGFFRFTGFLISIFLMMPLLLSLGFFDLWFDFRSKFRQS